jgi:hypothetical protein
MQQSRKFLDLCVKLSQQKVISCISVLHNPPETIPNYQDLSSVAAQLVLFAILNLINGRCLQTICGPPGRACDAPWRNPEACIQAMRDLTHELFYGYPNRVKTAATVGRALARLHAAELYAATNRTRSAHRDSGAKRRVPDHGAPYVSARNGAGQMHAMDD